MTDRLAGKRAIVTGGGRGIGRGITERFLEEGASVIMVQRHEPSEPFTHSACSFVPTDLRSSPQIAALMRLIADRFGALHILVNNAGIMFEKTVEDMSEAEWDSMMNVNLKAPFLLMKYAVPLMRNAGGGSIINIGSIEGLGSNPGHPAYSASKAGLHGMTAGVAVDHGRDGIRCNAIAPGWIQSNLSDAYVNSMPDSKRVLQELMAMHPVGRLGHPRDIGNLAVWLASEESDFVTGQVFVVDGGRTKKLPLPVSRVT